MNRRLRLRGARRRSQAPHGACAIRYGVPNKRRRRREFEPGPAPTGTHSFFGAMFPPPLSARRFGRGERCTRTRQDHCGKAKANHAW